MQHRYQFNCLITKAVEMDRFISSPKKKCYLFKPFEWLDLIPYSVALALLLGGIYILCRFAAIYQFISS